MNNNFPLVSIICLCYNQKRFVHEAILSVINQTYPNTELILVDDASNDGSQEEIKRILKDHPHVPFIALPQNLGNCAAFNKGLALAKGKYIIDLAGDDVLFPERVAVGVKVMEDLPEKYGVHFTDAVYIDENSKAIGAHFKRDKKGKLIENVPIGNVYKEVIKKYFICSPTMMIRKEVFDKLGGYDESLSYEDFDFWVRSSSLFYYAYTDLALVKKRVLKLSHSKKQVALKDKALLTNYKVCEKIFSFNQTEEENKLLQQRVVYEIRQALFTRNFYVAEMFLKLLKKIQGNRFYYWINYFLVKSKIPIFLLNEFRKKPK